MTQRSTIRARARPVLEAGETIQEVFPARTARVGGFVAKSWIVAATDRNIVIFFARRLSQTTPSKLVLRLPRETRLGPVNGGMFTQLNVNVEGKPILAQRRFFPDVERADGLRT